MLPLGISKHILNNIAKCVCVCVCSGFSVQCTIIYHLCWLYRHTPLKIRVVTDKTREGIAFLLRQTQVVVAFSGQKTLSHEKQVWGFIMHQKTLIDDGKLLMGLPWLHLWRLGEATFHQIHVIILLLILIWNFFFQCLRVPCI